MDFIMLLEKFIKMKQELPAGNFLRCSKLPSSEKKADASHE